MTVSGCGRQAVKLPLMDLPPLTAAWKANVYQDISRQMKPAEAAETRYLFLDEPKPCSVAKSSKWAFSSAYTEHYGYCGLVAVRQKGGFFELYIADKDDLYLYLTDAEGRLLMYVPQHDFGWLSINPEGLYKTKSFSFDSYNSFNSSLDLMYAQSAMEHPLVGRAHIYVYTIENQQNVYASTDVYKLSHVSVTAVLTAPNVSDASLLKLKDFRLKPRAELKNYQ